MEAATTIISPKTLLLLPCGNGCWRKILICVLEIHLTISQLFLWKIRYNYPTLTLSSSWKSFCHCIQSQELWNADSQKASSSHSQKKLYLKRIQKHMIGEVVTNWQLKWNSRQFLNSTTSKWWFLIGTFYWRENLAKTNQTKDSNDT